MVRSQIDNLMCPLKKDKVKKRMWPQGEDGLGMVPWEEDGFGG
jgi:hypothetical protein